MDVIMTGNVQVRLDKWLWAARFYKTRAIAHGMIDGGKVHYNGQRSKPSKTVEIGAMLKLWQGDDQKEVEILALSDKRGNALQAQHLYRETQASIDKRTQAALARKANALSTLHSEHRPNKKERRELLKFKQQSLNK